MLFSYCCCRQCKLIVVVVIVVDFIYSIFCFFLIFVYFKIDFIVAFAAIFIESRVFIAVLFNLFICCYCCCCIKCEKTFVAAKIYITCKVFWDLLSIFVLVCSTKRNKV